MTIVEMMMLLCFFGCLGIVFLKIWNITNILVKLEKGYEGIWIFTGFAGYLILWLFLMQILANDPATNYQVTGIYFLAFSISNFLMFLASMFTIIEIFLKFTSLGQIISKKSDFRTRGVSNNGRIESYGFK